VKAKEKGQKKNKNKFKKKQAKNFLHATFS
jgi:hypothetical protein